MSIIQYPQKLVGEEGVIGSIKYMVTTDNLLTVTTAGYLNNIDLAVYPIYASDRISCIYSYNIQTNSGTLSDFTVTISNGIITMVPAVSAGNVLLPVVSGNFPIFNGTTGQIKDSGISPSDPTKPKVASVNIPTTINGRIAVYSDAAGTIGLTSGTAVTAGNLQAGVSGTAGTVSSFPATPVKGSLRLAAADNVGDTATIITNASMAQASTITIPDPGAASANFLLNTGATQMAAGSRLLLAKVTGTEAANAITLNGQAGTITTSSLTIAGGTQYSFTWTNSFIATNSVILLSWMTGTNTKTNVLLRVASGNGTATVNVFNNGPDPLDGTIIIGFTIF